MNCPDKPPQWYCGTSGHKGGLLGSSADGCYQAVLENGTLWVSEAENGILVKLDHGAACAVIIPVES